MKLAKFTGIATIIFGSVFLFFEIFPKYSFLPENQEVTYILKKDTLENSGYISSDKPNKVKIEIAESKAEEKLTIPEFNKKYKLKGIDSTTPDPERSLLNRILGITYVIMGSLLLLFQLIFKRKRKRKKAANTL